jgi:hypothetical protein
LLPQSTTFALSGKVLLIGMDIRNPRLNEYLNIPDRGFTNCLSSDLKMEDRQAGKDDDFYVLPSGVVPQTLQVVDE